MGRDQWRKRKVLGCVRYEDKKKSDTLLFGGCSLFSRLVHRCSIRAIYYL